MSVGVRIDRREGATGVGAGFTTGADRVFGGLSASRLRYREFDTDVNAVAGYVGWSVIPAVETLYICPLVQGAYGRGPNDASTTPNTARTALSALIGLAVAGQIAVTGNVSLIPNVSGGLLAQQSTETRGTVTSSGSDFGGSISGGISVLLRQTVSIQPAVRLPIGFTDKDPVFSLGVTLGFRRAPR